MPACYFLAVCGGSAVDQHTNNVSLFNLVEQVNVPANVGQPPGGVVPVEVHAYWQFEPDELRSEFQVRFVMVAITSLETPSGTFKHRAVTARLRTRTMGLPYPPVLGDYILRVDWRATEDGQWQRESVQWPVSIQLAEKRPRVTH